ncbi:HTH-type transcriptional regulator MalT [Vibrio sp. SS-MA-C1-2]|uniref:HTH-type transcriptional regulator MalT n=1 Tax=Vibrio sp. SS-MA-C1-2 TaxID=2908646 RepID=UPI001F21D70F|nr:HTH-type transcriptional regulator MalT [Vibrio sp. SS-MA-C1-2]UJF17501.1 HTH-type transcriptional regulator MalT [Vibrio sp. SS-MA-C1-2]
MWIPSKITKPADLHRAIERPRLLSLLTNAARYRLVLFRSPAGYGKTTIASQWLSQLNHVAWFNLDENDNDPFRFVNYFIRAINKATNNQCKQSQIIAERRQFSTLSALFNELFIELSQFNKQLYVALDDYHLINNDEINRSIRFFIKQMPENITVVITSRSQPTLGIANLRVRNQLIEVGVDQLAFDHDETSYFFEQRVTDKVTDSTINEIVTQIEGWPSALQLIALHTKQVNADLAQSALSMVNYNKGHLWEYLAEEIFDLLPENQQNFLLQCSVFSTFNAQLIIEVTGQIDAPSMLEQLHKQGVFLSALEGEYEWFKFHNLFREFLIHQRQLQLPNQEIQIHTTAAHAWLKQGSLHQALEHAMLAKNSALIIEILLENSWGMFQKGEFSLLDKALEKIDSESFYTYPRLLVLRAWLAQGQHRYQQVGHILEDAMVELAERGNKLDDSLLGEINALKAQAAINCNDPVTALNLSQEALGQLDSNDYRSRIVATSIVGEVHHVLGHLSRALPMMQQTEKIARQHKTHQQALWAILQQSEILIAQGQLQAAYELQENAFKLIKDQHLQQVPLYEFLLRIRANILWSWYRLDEAEDCIHEGLAVLANSTDANSLHCYAMLARIALSRGEIDKASRYLDTCQTLINNNIYHIDWLANTYFVQINYWQLTGNQAAIKNWLAVAERPDGANNHFQQLQYRNIVRAQILLGELTAAEETLKYMIEECDRLELITDKNRNLILKVLLRQEQNLADDAYQSLKDALQLTSKTGVLGDYLLDSDKLQPLLQALLKDKETNELEQHRINLLLSEMCHIERSNSTHFDEAFVEQLLSHPNIPELIRVSPLTQREWQVLGLIYAGFTNDQISNELNVAITTIKTHIRNLYQKLSISNRKEAIMTAEELLSLVHIV